MQKIFRVHVETAGLSCAHWLLNVQQLWSLSQEANQTQPIKLRQVRLLKHWFRKRTVNSTLNWARTLDFEMFCSTLLGQFFKLGLLLELLVWQWTRFLATRYARHVKGIYKRKKGILVMLCPNLKGPEVLQMLWDLTVSTCLTLPYTGSVIMQSPSLGYSVFNNTWFKPPKCVSPSKD